MFAVPGWAVSADSLTVTSKGHASEPENTKKRKRVAAAQSPGSQISADSLQKLWNKEFSNAADEEKSTKRSRSRKTSQVNDSHDELKGIAQSPTSTKGSSQVNNDAESNKLLKNSKSRHEAEKGTPLILSSGSKPVFHPKAGSEKSSKKHETQAGHKRKAPTEPNKQALEQFPDLPPPSPVTLTPLQAKMRDKLTSARFRHLNETLYTTSSSASLALFAASPDLFAEYHAGFSQQVRDSWPENPVDGYLVEIRARAPIGLEKHTQVTTTDIIPLPRRKTGSCTVVDLGCGDAPLARSLHPQQRSLNLRFHSYDLHKVNEFVTVADVAKLPLRDGEADIAIFCLSLMGTNWITFIEEAWRVLRGDGKGELWVSEVKSRFSGTPPLSVGKKALRNAKAGHKGEKVEVSSVDGGHASLAMERSIDEGGTDISAFVSVVERRGFSLQAQSVKKSNKMFVAMSFLKNQTPSTGKYQGLKWNGHRYEKPSLSKTGRKSFVQKSDVDGVLSSPEEEAKALKPCVYKKR